MLHPRAHNTKWTVLFLATCAVARFEGEEAARTLALECGDGTPVRVIAPIYR